MTIHSNPTVEFPASLIRANGFEERFTLTYDTVEKRFSSSPVILQAGDTIVIHHLPRWLRKNG